MLPAMPNASRYMVRPRFPQSKDPVARSTTCVGFSYTVRCPDQKQSSTPNITTDSTSQMR